MEAEGPSDIGGLRCQGTHDALKSLILTGLHCRCPQGQPCLVTNRPPEVWSSPRRPGIGLGIAATLGSSTGVLAVGAVSVTAQLVDRPFDHLAQLGGIVTRILATLMLNTKSRSVSKSNAARASLVCSSIPRIPFQPPHCTSR